MIDVTEQVSAVRREVGGRVLEAGQAQVVTVSAWDSHSYGQGQSSSC
jgi:predicted GTPase